MIAVLAAGALSSPGAHAAGSVSLSLADAPASPRDPRAAFYIVDAVKAGAQVDRVVRVQNDGDAPAEISLYVGGAVVRAGALQFNDRGEDRAPIAQWSRVEPPKVALAPGASADAQVRIDVPERADEGEELGVVWAETRGTGLASQSVNRVGVRIYLAVADRPPRSDLALESLTASRDSAGRAQIEVTVRNAGRREIEPSGTIAVRGGSVSPMPPRLALVPGARGTMVAALPGSVAGGPVALTVEVQANGVSRRADATVQFPDGAGTRADPIKLGSSSGSSRTGPTVLALLVDGVAIVGVARARRRSMRD